jgi:DNA adenine methylase
VLFHKNPGNDYEVYNDRNGLLVNLFRCVRDKPRRLIAKLRFALNSRADFECNREALAKGRIKNAVERAAAFYQLIRYSYASGLKSFAGRSRSR